MGKEMGYVMNIVHTPGVCGGRACIDNTRLPVWVLVNFHRMGTSDAELLNWYPSLTQYGLTNALTYAFDNKAEIDKDIADQTDPLPPLTEDDKLSGWRFIPAKIDAIVEQTPSRWSWFVATMRQWFHLIDDIWRSVKRSIVDAVHIL
jgi:uncharacterized protein (DUF433 family)